ncbi:ABC transporter permease [Vibrio tapetis subsp. quintayensis]|uniref:ABC transporter permease n=1 Tax=Vibrio tapetis TaxID=52443 RepID=UPI0025B4D74D|nr:ABC transporter permease [Vibrio tapetis]MDN3682560.1 ABC transporter permease [Vibrio tapetis subsp. quintayensis]
MSWWTLIKKELMAILTHPAIVVTVFGGTIFYSFLYPLPYAHQVAQEQEITVVNLDKSQSSYQLERMVDATPQVKIATRAHTIEQAKQQFLNKQASGILVIPEHFYKDLLLGKSPTLAYAGDASYFLVYGTVVEGLAKASGTLGAQAKVAKLVMEGEPMALASEQHAPIHLNLKPTFNPKMGYVDYVVPAVFVIILHQTLLMGVGILTCSQRNRKGYWSDATNFQLLAVRVGCFSMLYVLLSLFYFGYSFEMYEINRLAAPIDLAIVLVPFLFSASLIGVCVGRWVPRTELVTLLVLLSSMPLIFSAGFIWPVESIPSPIVLLSNLIPSTPAIMSFLKINQMGASITQIKELVTQLWLLTLLWGVIAWVSMKVKTRTEV